MGFGVSRRELEVGRQGGPPILVFSACEGLDPGDDPCFVLDTSKYHRQGENFARARFGSGSGHGPGGSGCTEARAGARRERWKVSVVDRQDTSHFAPPCGHSDSCDPFAVVRARRRFVPLHGIGPPDDIAVNEKGVMGILLLKELANEHWEREVLALPFAEEDKAGQPARWSFGSSSSLALSTVSNSPVVKS